MKESTAWRRLAERIATQGLTPVENGPAWTRNGVGLCREVSQHAPSPDLRFNMAYRISEHLDAGRGPESLGECLDAGRGPESLGECLGVVEADHGPEDIWSCVYLDMPGVVETRILAALFLALECEDEGN